MNTILEWDRGLFLWLHDGARTSWGDILFPWLTDADHFRIPLVIFWVLLMILGGGRGRKLGILLAVSVLLTDQISSSVLKPWVDRIRPCFALDDVVPLISQSRSPSFPSSHAANSFGVAVLIGLALGRWAWSALILALAISFSRVYVGVHYPLDVTAGALLGAGIGCLIMGSLGTWLRLGGRRKAVSSPAPADSPDAGPSSRLAHRERARLERARLDEVPWPGRSLTKRKASPPRGGASVSTWRQSLLPRWWPLSFFLRLPRS